MEKRFWLILRLILLISVLIRIESSHELLGIDQNVTAPLKICDMYTYHQLSTRIVESGYGSIDYYDYQPFYYAVFLVGVKLLFGINNIGMIIICQALVSALAILFASLSARILWNNRAGIITAVLMSLSQVLVFFTSYMLIETLQSFFIALVLFLSIKAYNNRRLIYYALLGLTLGCSIATRGNMTIIALALLFFFILFSIKDLLLKGAPGRTFVISRPVILAIMIAAPIIPFSIKNTCHLNRITGASVAADKVFLLGNSPDSPPGGLCYSYIDRIWEAESGSWTKEFIKYLKDNKLSYLDFLFNKALLFWDYREIPNNINVDRMSNKTLILKYVAVLKTSIIIIFGLSGLIFSLLFIRKKPVFAIPLIITVLYWLSIIAFYNLGRFRLPVIPLLSVYAGGFLCCFLDRETIKKKAKFCFLLSLPVFFAFITFFSYNLYYISFEPFISRYIRPSGLTVDLGAEMLYQDSAAYFLNSLQQIKLEAGTVIVKQFATGKDRPGETGNIRLLMSSAPGSSLDLEINGIKKRIDFNNGNIPVYLGNEPQSCTIEDIPFGNAYLSDKTMTVLTLKIISVTGNVFCYIDSQRNYGRTSINGSAVGGELYVTLLCGKNRQ